LKKKIYKIISWTLVVLTVLSLVLMVIRPSGRAPETSPDAARSFDEKWGALAAAHAQGQPSQVRLTESELNSKMQQAFEGAPAGGVASLTSVAARLEDDRLVFVMTIRVLGLNTYITLGGKPVLRDHLLQFDLTKVAMGRMPVPASTIGPFLRQNLEAPEMRDAMTLPEFIRDVRVDKGELVFDAD
jgi:uncharacterized protein YpmS